MISLFSSKIMECHKKIMLNYIEFCVCVSLAPSTLMLQCHYTFEHISHRLGGAVQLYRYSYYLGSMTIKWGLKISFLYMCVIVERNLPLHKRRDQNTVNLFYLTFMLFHNNFYYTFLLERILYIFFFYFVFVCSKYK